MSSRVELQLIPEERRAARCSLIDPDTRWWRKNRTRRIAAYLCIALGIVAGFVGSWGMFGMGMDDDAVWVPQGVALAGIITSIPLIVGGSLIYGFGVDEEGPTSRMVIWSLPVYFIANGTGSILGAYQAFGGLDVGHAIFVIFIVGGIVAVLLIEVLRRRSHLASRLRERVERSGVTTSGIVTRAKSYSLNYRPVTRVTVRFTDTNGQPRWASQTVSGNISKGSQLKVRYLPGELSRKAAVTVREQ
ncbi:hypothetical protein [Brucella cytisi]|uniref:hypothetical protein n=1 Tax=Brucella cytisi TaxID=407152 RepID=UPI001160B1C1|nr:hypothetical protein [Brucella cytisi]